MGPVMSSLPERCHAAELTLLSVVGAKAATLCCQKERWASGPVPASADELEHGVFYANVDEFRASHGEVAA
jgi:hypothetical protein